MTPIIRQGDQADAQELSRLHTVLGHPTSEEEILQRWDEWIASGGAVLVAQSDDGSLVGFATLFVRRSLHRPRPVGRITSLVVDERLRGQGIGRALVAAAEGHLTASGCGELEVTSHYRHTTIYPFYEHLGYAQSGVRFVKPLASG